KDLVDFVGKFLWPGKTTWSAAYGEQGMCHFGIRKCEVHCNATTIGMAEDVRLRNSEMFQQRFQVVEVGILFFCGIGGPAKTAPVIADDFVVLCKSFELIVPVGCVTGKPMNKS